MEEEAAEEAAFEAFSLDSNMTNDPSYTRLELPLRVRCRHRYQQAIRRQRRQFLKEIREIEALQAKALDGVRIHREFCNPILRKARIVDKVQLTDQEKRRIEALLKTSD